MQCTKRGQSFLVLCYFRFTSSRISKTIATHFFGYLCSNSPSNYSFPLTFPLSHTYYINGSGTFLQDEICYYLRIAANAQRKQCISRNCFLSNLQPPLGTVLCSKSTILCGEILLTHTHRAHIHTHTHTHAVSPQGQTHLQGCPESHIRYIHGIFGRNITK